MISYFRSFGHKEAFALKSIEFPPKLNDDNEVESKSNVIMDIPNVNSKDVIENKKFPGIYTDKLPQKCYLTKDTIVTNTYWQHCCEIILINIETNNIQKLSDTKLFLKHFNETNNIPNEIARNLFILDIDPESECILFEASSMQRGQSVHVYDHKNQRIIDLVNKFPKKDIDKIQTKVIPVKANDNSGDIFECILHKCPPKLTSFDKDPVLLLYMHGGPHSMNSVGFSKAILLFLYFGISVVHVNYRGSIGMGNNFGRKLSGNIGSMDVKDCIHGYDSIIKTEFNNIPLKQIVIGGSHGGFLTTHIIGQYPDKFLCASSRNPVTNLVSMFSLTDIPDWVLHEGLGNIYDYDKILNIFKTRGLTSQECKELNDKSPYSHLHKVITPLQLLLGTKDQRVPMQQSIEYYKILKAKNGSNNVRMLIYDKCQHSLNDDIQQQKDVWINIISWFEYHIKKS